MRTQKQKGWINKSAKIFTNDPKTPELKVEIQGNLWVPISISSEHVHLKGRVGTKLVETIVVKGQKKEPLKITDAVVSVPDKVSLDIQSQGQKGEYLLTFKNRVESEGLYWGSAVLTTNYPDQPLIKIEIRGAVQSVFRVIPKVLSLPPTPRSQLIDREPSGAEFKPRRVVIDYLGDGADLKIEGVNLKESLFSVVTKEIKPGRRFELVVKPVPSQLSDGRNADVLEIETNQAHEKVIQVPIYLTVMK